ncbi:MAG: magnesium and cobalt exporter, family [Clostridiales bacterium]|nr:magnesium and cobalt exporter, family [Clostridiales bacterium]
MEDGNPLWLIGVILLLIAVEAIIVSARRALLSVNETGIRKELEENHTLEKQIKRVLLILDKEDAYLKAAQVVIGATNLIMGILFARGLVLIGMMIPKRVTSLVLLFCISVCLLLVIILLSSVIPEKLAIRNPRQIALSTSRFFQLCYLITLPFVYFLDTIAKLIFWVIRINPDDFLDNVTEDEIISIVNEGFEQGVLEDNEVEMISNIIELDDKEVRDVMTNRRKVVSIDAKLTLKEAMEFMLGERYTRFPLYEDERDNIIGILHFKDVTQHYIMGDKDSISLREIAREAYFVPDTQSVDTLLGTMQKDKIHMAIAVDEYGQMAGVVALEDILEEIVGNIMDEFDEDERMIIKQGNSRFIMRGMAALEEVEDELDISMQREDYDIDTLNGFLISFIGHLPADDEKPVIRYKGYRFHVLEAKNNMIRTVRVVQEKESVNKPE